MSEQVQQQQEKRLIINRHTVCTIPNLLVLIRILCVPIYMTLLILGSRASEANSYASWWVYLALGIMIFAACTDVFDGKIARKYKAGTKIGKYTVKHDQGTYLGQAIDPIADKAMHIGALIALAVATTSTGSPYLHWGFIIALVMRELAMVVVGAFVINAVNVQANMLGKVASAIISCGIILCFFHEHISKLWGDYGIDWIVVTIGLVLNWSAAVNYAIGTVKQLKENKAKKALEEQKATENAVENEVTDLNEDNE